MATSIRVVVALVADAGKSYFGLYGRQLQPVQTRDAESTKFLPCLASFSELAKEHL